MAVTMRGPKSTGKSSWLFSWTSDLADPVYDVYINGRRASRQRQADYNVTVDLIDTVVVEVLDDLSAVPTFAASNRGDAYFDRIGALRYDVEHDDGTGFKLIAQLPSSELALREKFRTPPFDDGALQTLKVTPILDDGTVGTPAQASGDFARHANVPLVGYVFNPADRKVTIT